MQKHLSIIRTYVFLLVITVGCQPSTKIDSSEEVNVADQIEPSVTQVNDQPNLSFKMKLWEKEVDFYARGNEPSWALDIDFDQGIKFTTLDEINIETAISDVDKAEDNNITRIRAKIDSGDIVITVSEENCTDNMSGEAFKNKVTVVLNPEGNENYRIFEGCGQYVPDYSLHDIWVLTTINGEPLDPDRFPDKGSPTFEFYAEEGRVSGHAGCNNFNGSFYVADMNVLHFEPFAMTRMMCADMEIENLIEKSVAGRRLKYEIKDVHLTLEGYDSTVLVFKKVD
jgi:heat shock protein HslJ